MIRSSFVSSVLHVYTIYRLFLPDAQIQRFNVLDIECKLMGRSDTA
jgi:hypothetical protein